MNIFLIVTQFDKFHKKNLHTLEGIRAHDGLKAQVYQQSGVTDRSPTDWSISIRIVFSFS